ncbi:MAG: hypothetical protein P4M11_00890 [Candidatus Pacebacteria bacterium]|nr:hypothetical protein [Candidatus Paceibacterota bacterium]
MADEGVDDIHVRRSITQGPVRSSFLGTNVQAYARRVLVVDDDYTCAFAMEEFFRTKGIDTEIVTSILGTAAIGIVRGRGNTEVRGIGPQEGALQFGAG